MWRRAGAAWGERGRECRARETRGNGRGEHGGAFYGLGKAGSRPDVAESAGEVGRRRGVVEGLTGADFRGESGGNGGGRGGDRAHVVGCELGCGRAPDFAATWAAMAVGVGRREVGGGADGWDRRSHLSAKGEKEGRKTDFCERAKGEGSRPERGRRRAGRGRGRRGRNLGRARKGGRGSLFCFLFI